MQEQTILDDLSQIPLPDQDLRELVLMRNDLPKWLQQFDTVADQMNRWLGVAHMTTFSLEQAIKDGNTVNGTAVLEDLMDRMAPLVNALVEAYDEMEDMDDDTDDAMAAKKQKMVAKMTLAKIQSEWSGLQHFVESVKKAAENVNEEKELASAMEGLLLHMDDLSTLIFQYHERKHAAVAAPDSTSPPAAPPASGPNSSSTASTLNLSPSMSGETTRQQSQDEAILAEIDTKVEPVFHEVERVYARMTSEVPPKDASGVLARKHVMVQERWERLRTEIDDLKCDLKEDRWLTVFRQVADQVDVMIDGLEKTTAQCYTMICQVRDWQASAAAHAHSFDPHAPQPPKGVLKNVPRPHASNTSTSSTSSSGSTGYNAQPPVDYHKFRSAEKNFEAKYKYYTPSIDRMLAMLGNGINARVGRDHSTISRHQSMVQRWNKLKTEMDDLRLRDLPETGRLVANDRPVSPAWSRLSDRSNSSFSSWNHRSPEPYSGHDAYDYMAGTARSRSPYANSSLRASLSQRGGSLNGTAYDEGRRGRSATPSSGAGRDMWRSLNHPGSPSPPVYGRMQRTVSPLSSGSMLRPSTSDSSSVSSSSLPRPAQYETRRTKTPTKPAWNASVKTEKSDFDPLWKTEERKENNSHQNKVATRKSRTPTPRDDRASWMKPTKSTILRRQQQEAEQQRQQQQQRETRSKTPSPSTNNYLNVSHTRPRSSMEHHSRAASPSFLPVANYPDRERAMSPVRRSGTPSLIPRPKTPSGPGARAASPMIPRPRSSMQTNASGRTMLQVF